MSNFKVGDWVYDRRFIRLEGKPKLLQVEHANAPCSNDWVLWQPQQGEWCWFRSDNMPKYIQVLAQFKKYYNGKYAVVFNPKDVEEGTEAIYYTECEPFIGELPSFIKDN